MRILSKELLAEERYEILPQMREYDSLRQFVTPYLCQLNARDFKGKHVETDKEGFRISFFDDIKIDTATWFSHQKKGLLLGGSVAFGWGASADKSTLSSHLATEFGMPFHTLGIMAANSLIEFIAGVPFYSSASVVISCSGNNTLYSHLASEENLFDRYGPLFPFNNHFYKAMADNDLLFLSYLVSDEISPRDYFKTPHQKALFKSELKKKFLRRIKAKFGTKNSGRIKDRLTKSLEKSLDMAVQQQCRDAENMDNVSGKAKFICALQPFLPALNRELSTEENKLKEIQKSLLRKDIFDLFYGSYRDCYNEFNQRVYDFCYSKGICCIDMQKLEYPGWCFADSSHFTDHGNKIAAAYLREMQ